jgi:hypothetical protein
VKKIVKLALFIGVIAILAKIVAAKMADWEGLTESEVRAKLESRLPKQVPDEKRATIADKVVSGMRERGALRDEEEPSAPDTGSADEKPDSDDPDVSEESDEVTASA